jgi:hypothetical protein
MDPAEKAEAATEIAAELERLSKLPTAVGLSLTAHLIDVARLEVGREKRQPLPSRPAAVIPAQSGTALSALPRASAPVP